MKHDNCYEERRRIYDPGKTLRKNNARGMKRSDAGSDIALEQTSEPQKCNFLFRIT